MSAAVRPGPQALPPPWRPKPRSTPRSQDTMRMLTNRINIFVSLPIRSLDALSLQKQLDATGKNQDRAPDTPEVA